MIKSVILFFSILTFSFFAFTESSNSQKEDLTLSLNISSTYKYDENRLSRWFYPKGDEKGAVLLIHGLNVNPSMMKGLVDLFLEYNISVFRLSLEGHRGNIEEFKNVTKEGWDHTVSIGIKIVSDHAKSLKIPFYLTGFSMGGALLVDYLMKNSEEVKHIFLFAPAIDVKWYAHLAKPLCVLPDGLIIPSKTLGEYGGESGTPVAAYAAILKTVENINDQTANLLTFSATIFVHEDDELISPSGIRKFIKKNELSSWEVISVDNQNRKRPEKFNHLIIDENSLGTDEWSRVQSIIKSKL